MRVHNVTMTGFGPYKGTEVVDFDSFEDAGLFLIAGKTGAGKSSILDAVTFGLYGRIPRYDGAAGEQVRSDHISPDDPCSVRVEFTAGQARYAVTRSPEYERPKLRGEGTTTQKAQAEFARWNGQGWEVEESQVRNVAERIDEVVRLNASQFQQVILLAQGQFQEFLVADSDKRRELLRTLFGTKRFSEYSDELDGRARALRDQLSSVAVATRTEVGNLATESGRVVPTTLDTQTGVGVVEWAHRIVVDQQAAVAEAGNEEKVFKATLDTASAAFDAAKSLAERQQRRAKALARQAELAAQAEAVAADRVRLEVASRADLAAPAVARHAEAEAEGRKARQEREVAQDAFQKVRPGTSEEFVDLVRTVEELTESVGSLRDHVTAEESLTLLRVKAALAAAALEEFDAQTQEWVTKREELRRQLKGLDDELPKLAEDAGLLPEAKAILETVTGRLAAAKKAETTTADLTGAKLANLEAGKAVTEASATRDALRSRQLAGYAAVLAERLVPDEACMVCGSPSHPAPAVHGEDHVTDDDLLAAEDAYEAAVKASQVAGNKASALAERLEQEQAQANHEGVAALTTQVASAATERDRLASIAEQHAARTKARAKVVKEAEGLDGMIEGRRQRRDAFVVSETAAKSELEQTSAAVAQARSGHASVAERLADVTKQLTVTRELRDAVHAVQDAEDDFTTALADLIETLARQQFADAASVAAARVPATEQKTLRQRVEQHAADTKAVQLTLEADDLRDLPADPVDVEGPQAAHAQASTDHRAAFERHTLAQARLTSVARLAGTIKERLIAAAEVRERYQVVNRLAATVKGQTPNTMKMNLESFVLAAELEEIVRAANGRLREMTSGRYELQHSDALAKHGAQSGLSLDVMDAHTGEARPPQSLSGGEKFQASLALALGLAEVVTNRAGGLKLETLFVDEGFGSLSDDTLETTMATLDSLREGGRIVGLISHVQSMKENIPAQLQVKVTDGGWSTIQH